MGIIVYGSLTTLPFWRDGRVLFMLSARSGADVHAYFLHYYAGGRGVCACEEDEKVQARLFATYSRHTFA